MKPIVTNVSANSSYHLLGSHEKKKNLLVITRSNTCQSMHTRLIDDRIFAKILLILACNPVRYVHIYIYRSSTMFNSHLFIPDTFSLPPCLVLDLPSPSAVFFSLVKDPVPVGRPCATSESRPSSRGRRLLNDANHLPRWRGTRAAATRQLQPKRRRIRAGDGTGFPYSRGVESVWASGIQISEDERAPRFSNLPFTIASSIARF